MVNRFRNRAEAGRLLATRLKQYKDPRTLVVGLARGGVQVAFEVAKGLDAPLDVLTVRKLGMPGHSELAIGAIAPGGIRVLDRQLIRRSGISPEMVEQITAIEKAKLEERERLYRAAQPARDYRDHTVIVVDDGIAMGATMRAAAKAVRQRRPARLVIAVPVASIPACEALAEEADNIVPLLTPDPLYAVGLWYEEFPQVSDAEVQRLLAESAPQAV